jgi:ABC-type branched-subunit amino acid transport system substrate-binding protein
MCSAVLLAGPCVAAQTVDILFVGETDAPAYFGARQGLSEANAQGEFLGVSYRIVGADTAGANPLAVVAAVNSTRLLRLSEQYRDLAVLNVTAADTELREACEPNLFHVGPSRAMLADAESQWQRKNPGSTARARAWHKTFRKYAASQLNSRYHEQFKQDMNDEAWAGWAAVKLLSDTIVRQPALTGARLIEQLQTNLAFDGQKGSDLSFRETGQLRQPLLLVDNDKIVGEAPVRGVVNTNNLDSLGLSFCPK